MLDNTPTDDRSISAPQPADPWAQPQQSAPVQTDPWTQPQQSAPAQDDPWAQPQQSAPAQTDPWAQPQQSAPAQDDPWAQPQQSAPAQTDPWAQPQQPAPAQTDPWAQQSWQQTWQPQPTWQPPVPPKPVDNRTFDERNSRALCILAYLGPIFFLMVLLIGDLRKDDLLRFHVNQALSFMIVEAVLACIPILGWLALIVLFVFWIIAFVGACQGKAISAPAVGAIHIIR